MQKIKVGVVGVGSLGQHHARVYASMPEAELVGVVDSRPGRAEEIAKPLGTKAYSSYEGLLGKVDAVSIAVPTILHAEIGEQFLNSGAHVLAEKPIAHTLADADKLIEAAKKNKRILQVGHLERFNPAVRQLRELVKNPRFFEAHRMGLFSPRSLDIDVILDLMIHDLDIISLLVPSPVADIKAVGIAIVSNRIDIANARLTFENGCVANVTASRVSTEKIRKLRLFHKQEYVSLDYSKQEMAVFRINRQPGSPIPEIANRIVKPETKEPLKEELQAFLKAVADSGPVECSGEDGRKALALALEIVRQAERAQALEIDKQ
jgi:predicted dehydrogenase